MLSAESVIAVQVYAASIMFGYFVRRVDKRFQLERSLGLLPQNQEEAVARLERLFSQVSHPHTSTYAPSFGVVSLPIGHCCLSRHASVIQALNAVMNDDVISVQCRREWAMHHCE